MISLSDSELAAVMEAARPLPPRDRDEFLKAVAAELSQYPEIGPGVIGRVVAKLQRQHLAPRNIAQRQKPDRARARGAGRGGQACRSDECSLSEGEVNWT
jgi:hypothetical protein